MFLWGREKEVLVSGRLLFESAWTDRTKYRQIPSPGGLSLSLPALETRPLRSGGTRMLFHEGQDR